MKAKVLSVEMTGNGLKTSKYIGLVLRASKDEIKKMLTKYEIVLIRAIGSAG